MKVAAIQMVAGSNLDVNLQQAAALLGQAAKQGAELAALPEYFCMIGSKDTDKLSISPVQPGLRFFQPAQGR